MVNQVFMTPLTREETVAVIAVVIVENLNSQGRYQDAMAVADIVLDHYPKFAYAMIKKSTSAYYLLKSKFYAPYPNVQDVPENQRSYLAYLQRVNQGGFERAEALGWRPVQR